MKWGCPKLLELKMRVDDKTEDSNICYLESLINSLYCTNEDDYDELIILIKKELKSLENIKNGKLYYLHAQILSFLDTSLSEDVYETKYEKLICDSAKACYAKGQYEYACILYEKDLRQEATNYYKLSALQGYAPAQWTYGIELFHGSGEYLKQDEHEALKYIEFSAGQLYDYAIEFLINICSDKNDFDDKYQKMLTWSQNRIQ